MDAEKGFAQRGNLSSRFRGFGAAVVISLIDAFMMLVGLIQVSPALSFLRFRRGLQRRSSPLSSLPRIFVKLSEFFRIDE